MFGTNKIYGIENKEVLAVTEIFLTIQGEGPFSGLPAIFIRLGGCNLACKFCDTEFDNFEYKSVEEILNEIYLLFENKTIPINHLVVITGGEPFRQDIFKLCKKLLDLGLKIQIETNGLIYREIQDKVSIVCSPKAGKKKYLIPNPKILDKALCIKILISKSIELYSDLPDWILDKLDNLRPKLLLHPIDEYDDNKNLDNIKLTIQLAHKYQIKLGLQIHKILNVR